MTEQSIDQMALLAATAGGHILRIVTATSLFDGHDAAINVMRRLMQAQGAEVIHLGHNRSVDEIVEAAVQEDADAIAVSSYQGGHVEFFQYMIDRLAARGAGHIQVFAGGGGVIIPAEIAALEDYGVNRIYAPEDGQTMGLEGLIEDLLQRAGDSAAVRAATPADIDIADIINGDQLALARLITQLEAGVADPLIVAQLNQQIEALHQPPVLGITGTGGAGKSSLTDELIRRIRLDQRDEIKIAVLAIDPTRRRTGGALLGDRIRMNAAHHPSIYMRSLATRSSGNELPQEFADILKLVKLGGFDLVIVETPGIGQGNAALQAHVDFSLYVMTPEFGAATQLEKIDMLDLADLVAINKFDRRGAQDALRDVAKQVQRNHAAFDKSPDDMPVYGTVAAHFNDDGVTSLYFAFKDMLRESGRANWPVGALPQETTRHSTRSTVLVPPDRQRYLADIAKSVRDRREFVEAQVKFAGRRYAVRQTIDVARERGLDEPHLGALAKLYELVDQDLAPESRALLQAWPEVEQSYKGEEHVALIRGRDVRNRLTRTTMSGSEVPRVALPKYQDDGELLRFLMLENLPGYFPFTAGVFAFKREAEDPTRLFAGEGDAAQTNRRFKALSEYSEAKRLSTAFDSVTLYGSDPDVRPDIYGKVGNSGVSIATLDDMKILYDGFDLTAPQNSVSMTINGPAPTILAYFLNAAIDQTVDKFTADNGRPPSDGERAELERWTLENVRGTVQADILKEDQGQNTCLFSTEFSLKMMGDIQAYFVERKVRNFYSVSISGYHIAEAGANPISQLAFTLANGFTYVEAYLARGLAIDDFAPNLSFFFSNGMDPEYTVMGRVARRIWATAMRDRYGANERSQKLKYHVQTSGRSLHAQEMAFNDIRTTLQALIATYDNCNSLHTNAYDEAVTTPTDESVRRALAIQLIINREWGLAMNENPNQGAFIINDLTDLVEEAVLQEFERISERGGVLGAMETGYQRGKIQDESLYYEHQKHSGDLPIVGVNTFRGSDETTAIADDIKLARSTDEVKQGQIARVNAFKSGHADDAEQWLARIRAAAIADENVFAVLMSAARHCSLGQLTDAFFEVGGQYRRNM